ncbi:hypothetical protein HOY82DRAFT_536479 [Tuber indicum]|nr:hypothetical protein HOY82DRAFT_536479 [Tuber indicum]
MFLPVPTITGLMTLLLSLLTSSVVAAAAPTATGASTSAVGPPSLTVTLVLLAASIPMMVVGGWFLVRKCARRNRSRRTGPHSRNLRTRWPIDGPESEWEREQRLAGEQSSRSRFFAGGRRRYPSTDEEEGDLERLVSSPRIGSRRGWGWIGGGRWGTRGGGVVESFELQGLGGGDPGVTAPRAAMVRTGPGRAYMRG